MNTTKEGHPMSTPDDTYTLQGRRTNQSTWENLDWDTEPLDAATWASLNADPSRFDAFRVVDHRGHEVTITPQGVKHS